MGNMSIPIIGLFLSTIGCFICYYIRKKRGKDTCAEKLIARILLYTYIAVIISHTLFPIVLHVHGFDGMDDFAYQYQYNLKPFRFIGDYFAPHQSAIVFEDGKLICKDGIALHLFIRNVGGNLALFLPLGILLPLAYDKCKRYRHTLLVLFLLSLSMELLQLLEQLLRLATRVCDVDDLILNTTGGMFGVLLYHIGAKVRLKIKPGAKVVVDSSERSI